MRMGARIGSKKKLTGKAKAAYHHQNGLMAYGRGNISKMVACFDDAIREDPSNPLYHYDKGRILNEMGRTKEAISCFDTSISLDPKNPTPYTEKALILFDMKEYSQVVKCCDQVIRITGTQCKPFSGKTGSVNDYVAAQDPICAIYTRGRALDAMDEHAKAVESFKIVLDACPTSDMVHCSVGFALQSMKEFKDAMYHLEVSLKLSPNNPTYIAAIAHLHWEMGKPSKALAGYDKAISLDPYDAGFHDDRGSILLDMGRYSEAYTAFDVATKMRPDASHMWYHKAISLGYLNNLHDALSCAKKAIKLDQNGFDTNLLMGVALLDLENPKKALKYLDRATQLDPDSDVAREKKEFALKLLK